MKPKGKNKGASKKADTIAATAKEDEDPVAATKAKKSRKSIAYHKARKAAEEQGQSAEEAKAAAKKATRYNQLF